MSSMTTTIGIRDTSSCTHLPDLPTVGAFSPPRFIHNPRRLPTPIIVSLNSNSKSKSATTRTHSSTTGNTTSTCTPTTPEEATDCDTNDETHNDTPPSPPPLSQLRTLYPPLKPFQNGTLVVDTIHTLYYEQYGCPHGIPALVLHGGPGAGCFPRHAQFFDPTRYRIVLLDQRGSARSTPRGDIRNNTLKHLIEDCEILRNALPNITQWGLVLGGSWGSTLALAYAQTHPTRIQALLLRGICLFRSQEINWLFGDYHHPHHHDDYDHHTDDDDSNNDDCNTPPDACVTVVSSMLNHDKMTNHRPDDTTGTRPSAVIQQAWRNFNAAVGINVSNDHLFANHIAATTTNMALAPSTKTSRHALHAYYDRLLSNNRSVQLAAAQSWMQWEATVSSLPSMLSSSLEPTANSTTSNNTKPVTATTSASTATTTMENIVLVGQSNHKISNTRVWGFRNHQGKLLHQLPSHLQTLSPNDYKETLRKNLTLSTTITTATTRITRPNDIQPTIRTTTKMRPVRPIAHSNGMNMISTSASAAAASRLRSSPEATSYVPAQAILTCFYSVNDGFVMNGRNILDDVHRIQHIPCIAIHGGIDPICPIDSALDLWRVYQTMELRIPLRSGHSMYDAAITNELLMATDYFAKRNTTQPMYT